MLLPNSVKRLSNILSPSSLAALLDWAMRGVILKLYIPKRYPTKHLLLTLLTEEELKKLIRLHGGEYIQIPRCNALRNKICAKKLMDNGLNRREIAFELELSPSYTYELLKEEVLNMELERPPKKSENVREKVLELREKGYNIRQIMRETGLSRSGVYRCVSTGRS